MSQQALVYQQNPLNLLPHQQISSGSIQQATTPQMGSSFQHSPHLQTPDSHHLSPRQNQQQMVIHETFSIPMLERKMMFLNEPHLQPHNQGGQVVNE